MSVHAPYNFVTLSRFVYTPTDWAKRISHDVPFADGICGEFDIEITAHTKMLIGGERGEENDIQTVSPFRLPDGTYAIPESSLRGMIRNVLEIAAFGRMQFVDDRRFGIRDLAPSAKPFYRDKIVGKARAGWLSFDGETRSWVIDECDFIRIEHSELAGWNDSFSLRLDKIKCETKQGERFARKLYEAWGSASLEHDFWVDGERAYFTPGSAPSGIGPRRGVLVFTGQPATWSARELARGAPGKKHLEFVFLAHAIARRHPLPPKVWADFLAIQDAGGKPSDNWAFWKTKRETNANIRIPVFFVAEKTPEGQTFETVRSLGLAMMFKLAQEHSVHAMVRNTEPNHLDNNIIDLPTAIFGEAVQDDLFSARERAKGLKSRVNMGLAKCIVLPDEHPREERTILAGPKPSYYPSYVRQPVMAQDSGQLNSPTYVTYTPTSGQVELRNPEIRGWKRYPVGRRDQAPGVPDGNTNRDVQVILYPLSQGTRFRSRVRFHNLRPVELGALLWALEWGGDPKLRHRLGMGKPYGYGQISIAVDDDHWELRPNGSALLVSSKQYYMDVFEEVMDNAVSEAAAAAGSAGCDWARSEQLVQLLAMANPAVGAGKRLDYMRLEMEGPNDFLEAKTARPPEVLPRYPETGYRQKRDHAIWPRKPVIEGNLAPGDTGRLTGTEQARRLEVLAKARGKET